MPEHADILVVGGGPAGIFAAVTAAQHGGNALRVALVEHNHVLGRKLGKTGNGRCNLTNRNVSIERYHGEETRFLHNVLPRFTSDDLLAWFEERGVEFKEEEDGRVFPVTDQASTIADVLKEEVARCGVAVSLGRRVEEVGRGKDGGFFARCAGGGTFLCRKLVLAAGGPAYPQLGATEDCYAFARAFGHTVVSPAPALVAFEIAAKSLFDLQGVKTRAEVKAYQGGRVAATATDELLFTHFGVSGPAVLHVSSFVTRGLCAAATAKADLPGTETLLRVNLFPGLPRADVEKKILSLWKRTPKRSLGNSLMGILPKKLPQVLFRNVLGLDVETPSEKITRENRTRIVNVLTNLELKVAGTRGFRDAQVVSGGVRTAEVAGRTMESRLANGLHFAGEVLDIDGDCGGFNLQFAFASGYLAGLAAGAERGGS
ncbi:MAG: NAD(P)/FAD-dependent oxidoreductase [Candidatus Aureabacteria bacterium]|nr:NAD(P)/FAD-dependent oxidoreductase [Candidatus Auribacterota bacterium]HOE26424.1 NAD(P)/FAD-dependent oxidoreductase [bacterium]HQM53608.1 NAD(P)/FAD-dependent oxidoreductase [bacterium]